MQIINTRLHVYTDRDLLTRILRNLVSNAVRYTSPAGKILVGCRRGADNHVRIQVIDTGCGIEKHSLPLIFQEYYQTNSPKLDRNKGAGLGLAIVCRLSKLLNHDLDVRSEYNKGSMFSVRLPLDCSLIKQPDERRETAAHIKFIDKLTVLVIDDNDAILAAMRSLFSRWGWVTMTARGREEAIESLKVPQMKFNLDLIIADYRLQENITGIHVIEFIREYIGRKVPAIVVTGDTSPEILKELHAGEYSVVHKPIAPAKLRSLINFTFQDTPAVTAAGT
jgi:CheY-like chemotaxis protein